MNKNYQAAIENAFATTLRNLDDFSSSFPSSNSENGFYQKTENVEWTTGFWTGILWLLFEYSHDQRLKQAAELQVESFNERICAKMDVNHHDMGFLYSPSCVAAYRIEENPVARKAALLAADNLVGRFRDKGQFIQAWGDLDDSENYRLIIDSLMNLPLLFWASETTGVEKYSQVAIAHLNSLRSVVVRADDSTYHTYYFDKATGKPTYGITRQGYRNDSAWARGQAWGVYGFALAYRHTGDPVFKELFIRVTDYFIKHLPEDLIPYWDFEFTNGSDEPRDSSASAIAVCGMLEMANIMEEKSLAEYYKNKALELLDSLIDKCASKDQSVSNGLLLHGTYAKLSLYNGCPSRGVDECNLWGDYFYTEALTRALGISEGYW